ncbi:hypothetical protein JTE90_018197 [Oedothorax gibbosus]|uniref:Uncharacterized protein n=1 Tax=Oedothorax gibbosus TaxID=931172 RepID=A0AAV6U9Q0_9ARAC|nr:hypothetical protein JTE90_018197 [Oedothorax gibbosus]
MKIVLEYLQTAKRLSVKDDLSAEELDAIIDEEFGISADEIKLQIYDQEFQAFCDLESSSEVKHLFRIKLINLESFTVISELVDTCASSPQTSEPENLGLRTRSWNNDFKLSFSSFDLITSEELKAAEEEFVATGKLHKPSYRLKSQINDVLSNELKKYGLYIPPEQCTTT